MERYICVSPSLPYKCEHDCRGCGAEVNTKEVRNEDWKLIRRDRPDLNIMDVIHHRSSRRKIGEMLSDEESE